MGQCRPVGSGARRSSSVLHQQRRHIFRIENVFPCPQDGLQRKKKILVSPNGDPTQHSVRVCNLRSSSWLHDNEERSKGRCCRVGPWGGGSGWRQWERWGGKTSLERHQNTAGIDRICAPPPIVEARTHRRRAPFPSASRSLRPVSLRLSLDPDKTRSNFCGLRPYRPLWPQMPCDADYDSQRARQLCLSTLPLRTTRGTEDWITMRRAANRTAVGMTCAQGVKGLKTLRHDASTADFRSLTRGLIGH